MPSTPVKGTQQELAALVILEEKGKFIILLHHQLQHRGRDDYSIRWSSPLLVVNKAVLVVGNLVPFNRLFGRNGVVKVGIFTQAFQPTKSALGEFSSLGIRRPVGTIKNAIAIMGKRVVPHGANDLQ